MNKNPQKQRMNIELNQIRSILNDFRKTKYKCVELAKSVNSQMPKEQHFKNIQKTTMRKMDLLDITGLVNLKNQLVRGLTQLFQIERQLRYKRQKFQARKQMMQAQNEERQYMRRNQAQSAIQSPINVRPLVFQTNVRSIVSQPKKQEIQVEEAKPKNRNLQIPLYRAKNQTNQNKLDRISKYVASLKRNMKLNSQTLGYKWKIKEFLLEDQNYLKLRTELQTLMMREQQLDNIFAKAVEKGVRDYIKTAQIVDSNPQYKLIKIYKHPPNKNKAVTQPSSNSNQFHIREQSTIQQQKRFIFQSPKGRNDKLPSNQTNPIISQFNSPKINKQSYNSPSNFIINSPLKNLSTKIEIQQKAEQDFKQIKRELQKSNESYTEMLSKINQTVQKRSQKLIQMRQKRKKKNQKTDDIWDELDKI